MTINDTKNGELVKVIQLLYLDDIKTDLDSFEAKLRGQKRFLGYEYEFELVKMDDPALVLEYFSNHHVDVFLCDHNMPDRKGLEFINIMLAHEYPETVFVIFSGAVDKKLNEECKGTKLRLINKTEDIDNIVDKLVAEYRLKNSLPKFPLRVGEDTYDIIANELIRDLDNIRKPENWKYSAGNIDLDIVEYYNQLYNKTDLGRKFVINYYNGLKFFNTRK